MFFICCEKLGGGEWTTFVWKFIYWWVFMYVCMYLFSIIESCFVSGLLLLKVNGNSKNDKNLLFHEYFVPLTHTIVMFNLSLKTNTLLPVVWVYTSYGIRTDVNSLEGCYGTTTPTMLRRFTIEEMNFRTFKHGFFLKRLISVTLRKNQNNSLRSGIIFSLTRLICSH